MTSIPRSSTEDAGRISDLERLFGKFNCIAYAYRIDEGDAPQLEWSSGRIFGQEILPLSDLGGSQLTTDDAARLRKHLERLIDGNVSELDLLWQSKAGSWRLRDSAHPEFDSRGKVVRILGTVRDVSFETWAEKETDEPKWLPRVLDTLPQSLCCWDAAERLVMTNSRFRTLHRDIAAYLQPGLHLEAFAALAANSTLFSVEQPRSEWAARFISDFREQRPRELPLSDGRTFEFLSQSIVDGRLMIAHDVTSIRSAERALRHAKEVAETADLKKSRFLRAANHDLRQPLATMKILIYSSQDPADEQHRKELLHSMDVSVSIMEDILGSLLQIGQLDADRIASRETHFQISQLLERLEIEFRPQAEAKGLRLVVMPCHLTLKTDRALLERILSNFLANAIRFTEVGTVLLGARRRGGELEIQTWDTGPGIPDDQLHLIFEEFHQVADRSSRKHKGLGLGLNIVQRLAELMRLRVLVRSRLGHGSMFSIMVPLGNVWQSQTEEGEISERIGGEFLGMNMLIVDDDEMLRTTMYELLVRWGVDVLPARDGDEAMRLLEEREDWIPNLVLVDYQLPNGSAGTDVLSRLRTRIPADVPGIVLTADTDPHVINAIRAKGVPVLIKPINPSRLRSLMHHLIFERDDFTP